MPTAAVLGKTKAVTGIAAPPWGLGSGLFVTLQTQSDSDTTAAKHVCVLLLHAWGIPRNLYWCCKLGSSQALSMAGQDDLAASNAVRQEGMPHGKTAM